MRPEPRPALRPHRDDGLVAVALSLAAAPLLDPADVGLVYGHSAPEFGTGRLGTAQVAWTGRSDWGRREGMRPERAARRAASDEAQLRSGHWWRRDCLGTSPCSPTMVRRSRAIARSDRSDRRRQARRPQPSPPSARCCGCRRGRRRAWPLRRSRRPRYCRSIRPRLSSARTALTTTSAGGGWSGGGAVAAGTGPPR